MNSDEPTPARFEPEQVWDQVESNTWPEQPARSAVVHRRLRLSASPIIRTLPLMRRSVSEIAPELQEAIRRVICGELPWPLFVHGPVGTGKTCAALALLDHAGGEYLTVASLADTLIESQQGRLEVPKEGGSWTMHPKAYWAMLEHKGLVVLDDLGTRNSVSDHRFECVRTLLDLRHGRPLLAISNFPLGQLAQLYDDRVASRLAAGTVVHLDGDDRRRRRGSAS